MPDSAYSLLFPSENQETQTPSTEAPVTKPVSVSPSGGSGSSAFGLLFGGSSPENGQEYTPPPVAPTQHLYQDSSQPGYRRAWDWNSTPLTETLFGLPEDLPAKYGGNYGVLRGLYHVVTGLTAPLSLELMIPTLGTGSIIESAGANLLRTVGEMAPEEIAAVTKGSQVALQAYKDSKDIEPVLRQALEAGGADRGLLQRARGVFGSINRDAELANPEIQAGLSKIGLNEAQRTALTEGTMSQAEREALATANGGFSNAELEELAKSGKSVSQAISNFKPIQDAVREAGVDPDLWKRGQDLLYKNGLSEYDLLKGNMVERGAYQILRNVVPDLPVAAAARAAKTANTLLNTGFTLQQLETAAAMSPRFLDALKEGDYDKAMEYGTEAAISGGLGVLGASHALHSAGELFKPLIENNKFRPNDEWLAIDRTNKEREAQHAIAEQQAINLDKAARDILGHTQPGALQQIFGESPEAKAAKNLDLASVFHQVVTGGDKVKAAQWYNALAEALGRDERLPVPGEEGPLPGLPPVGSPVDPNTLPRANTQVVHSNDAGEVRVGADGRPIVWMSPRSWVYYNSRVHPGIYAAGVSYSPVEVETKVLPRLGTSVRGGQIRDLLGAAQKTSPQNLGTVAGVPGSGNAPFAIEVAREELNHTWQRELSQNGQIFTHLDPDAFTRLHGIIPEGMRKYLENLGYSNPSVMVLESAAKLIHGDATKYGITGEEQDDFLDKYYKEVKEKHGSNALEAIKNTRQIAEQHVEDLYAQRRAAAEAARASRVANGEGTRGELPSLGEGRQGGVEKTPSSEADEPGTKARELAPEEAQKRGIENHTGAVATIYERLMKANGYEGYYHPGSQEIGVFKDTPVEAQLKEGISPLTGQTGLAARERQYTWKSLQPLITDEMRKDLDTPQKQQQFVLAFNSIEPNRAEWNAAVRAGSSGRLWYERSSRAFDALHKSQPQWFKAGDKEKFLNFVAATSPIDPVNVNLLRAVNMWVRWHEAGRPTDVKWGARDSNGFGNNPQPGSKLWNLLTERTTENTPPDDWKKYGLKGEWPTEETLFGRRRLGGESPLIKANRIALPAHQLNAARALMGEPLSGPRPWMI